MAEVLKTIGGVDNAKRGQEYKNAISNALKKSDSASLVKIAEHLVRVETESQHGRTYIVPEVLKFLLDQLARDDNEMKKWMPMEALEKTVKSLVDVLRDKADHAPHALMRAIDLMSQIHQANGAFDKAAHVLSSFRWDYRNLQVSGSEKVAWFCNTAEFYLEIEETGMASQQIKKAHVLLGESDVRINMALIFRFKTCLARALDGERKFLEAAQKYMELAQMGTGIAAEADLLRTLENAVTCAILAAAGPGRSRVLAMLISDGRSHLVRNYTLLEKMFRDRIVRAPEVAVFQKMLAIHQNAETKNGRTVLQNAIIEHNMFAASKIYNNITFAELGVLLGIKEAEAEEVASGMIEQGRMKASIDQVDGLVEFEAATDHLRVWDEQINAVCLQVNDILENVSKKHPQYKDY
jgi:COP9 signalosome complex subunit 4